MVLTAINQYPNVAPYAGVPYGTGYRSHTRINNALAVAAVTDVVITAADTTDYTLKIAGITITVTSDGSATAAEIRDLLIAAIEDDAYANALVTAVASGSNVRITERDAAYPAPVTESDTNLALTVVTAHSDAEPMPAGIAIAAGTGDQDGRLVRGSSAVPRGVVIHQHQAISDDDNGATSDNLYRVNSLVPVMDDGEIWVEVEEAVTPASAVYVRHTASGDNTQLGAFRASSDSSTAAAWTSAAYKSSADAGELARLKVRAL